MDQSSSGRKDIRSTGLVNQIHPEQPNPGKIFSRCTHALGLEQKLHISDKVKGQAVFLLEQQTVKVKSYKRVIDTLQSSVFVKPDLLLPPIEKPIN